MPDEKRIPITTDKAEEQPKAEIVAIMKPMEVSDFLPKFDYALQGLSVSSEANDLKDMLVSFLGENKELITNGVDATNLTDMEAFTKGFRNAIAMVNLWVDSMYITQ